MVILGLTGAILGFVRSILEFVRHILGLDPPILEFTRFIQKFMISKQFKRGYSLLFNEKIYLTYQKPLHEEGNESDASTCTSI